MRIKRFNEHIYSDKFQDVNYLIDIIRNITDVTFESKLSDYDANDYFKYLMDKRKESPVLFLWTFEDIDENELLKGLAHYQEKFKEIVGFEIHRISFIDELTFLVLRQSAEKSLKDTITMNGDISVKFLMDVFKDNHEVLSKIQKEFIDNILHYRSKSIGRTHLMSSEFWSMQLSSGIDFKNGDSSNLSLWNYLKSNEQLFPLKSIPDEKKEIIGDIKKLSFYKDAELLDYFLEVNEAFLELYDTTPYITKVLIKDKMSYKCNGVYIDSGKPIEINTTNKLLYSIEFLIDHEIDKQEEVNNEIRSNIIPILKQIGLPDDLKLLDANLAQCGNGMVQTIFNNSYIKRYDMIETDFIILIEQL